MVNPTTFPISYDEQHTGIVLTVLIWQRGDCRQGSFRVQAEGVDLDFRDSNWIYYDLDWTNQE